MGTGCSWIFSEITQNPLRLVRITRIVLRTTQTRLWLAIQVANYRANYWQSYIKRSLSLTIPFVLVELVNLLRKGKTTIVLIYKPWFEAIQFFGRRTFLSMILAWFSRKSARIRTITSSSSWRMCGNQVILSYFISQYQWNVRILSVILSVVWGWLKRFPWLAYSKFLDGAFCLPCVFFWVQCGRNSNKLDKLYKTPLTLWTSAMSRFTKHARGKCEMHRFYVIAMDNFLRIGPIWSIDQQLKKRRKKANKAL